MKKQFDKHILHGIVLAVSQEWHKQQQQRKGDENEKTYVLP
jgi:hypothetical protein